MIVTDKTGRKLKVGQMLDTFCLGMFQGKLIAIKEAPIVISKSQQIQPHIAIQIVITPFVAPDGSVPDVYIIGEPDPNDPLVKQSKGLIETPS